MDPKTFQENFPDIFEGVLKIVTEATETRVAPIERSLREGKREVFVKTLNDACPGWESMGQDSNWAAWLSQKHRYSNKTRLDLLKEANAAFDADAVANLIRDYRASTGVSPMTSTRPQRVEEGVTRSFIRQFYADVARGRYRRPGGEEERKSIQARIDQAIAAGTVR